MVSFTYRLIFFTSGFFLFMSGTLTGQCTSPDKEMFPYEDVIASQVKDTQIISNKSYPGSYFVMRDLKVNHTYRFVSSVAGDYFTIRNRYTKALLAHGLSPINFTASFSLDVIAVHIHTSSPPCGESYEERTTVSICTTCPEPEGKVGVNNNQPKATLDITGRIRVGDNLESPVAGSIRWNQVVKDFEGFNGTKWLSLTKANADSFGKVSSTNISANKILRDGFGKFGDSFGFSVAIYGDYAAIGSPFDDIASTDDKGSVFIFHKVESDWQYHAKITAADGLNFDNFGSRVALWEDYLLVGVPKADISGRADQGSAYLYLREGNNWVFQQKLIASDGAIEDYFGATIAIDNGFLAVGAFLDDVSGRIDQGSVYTYQYINGSWQLFQKIVADDGKAGDTFGYSVAMNRDDIAIGAVGADIGSKNDQGAVYLYRRINIPSEYVILQKFVASDGKAADYFGYAVSMSKYSNSSTPFLVIGAPYHDIGASAGNQGAIYIFEDWYATFRQQQLQIPNHNNYTLLGINVCAFGNYVVAMAPNFNTILFKWEGGNWQKKSEIVSTNGYSISTAAMSEKHIIGGSYESAEIFEKVD
ncbi:MAG: FG-GAP repeat protein [Saprospiraceae bacterium]|nr:FG-GAP repeat protein [Saprospiraceae bacterium]